MKKPVFAVVLVGLSAAFLGGCPVFPDHDNISTGVGSTCVTSSDCPTGSRCASSGACVETDCASVGCDEGFTCIVQGGAAVCVDSSTIGSDASSQSDASTPIADASADAAVLCHKDAECAGTGSKCLSGVCTSPANQCSDFTQCAAGSQCVEGACTPTCSVSKACPTGFACDANGVCTGNPTPCTESGNECTGGTTCVEEHCVDPCSSGADGGDAGACNAGLVCVDNGCTPKETPAFVCSVEGQLGTGADDSCKMGSVCIHHNCYIACNADAGDDDCKTSDSFNVCKSVTSGASTFSVCGSSTNLGSECDPTAGKACASPKVCIDGFCK